MFCGKFSKIHLAKKGNHFIQEILLRKNINEPPIRRNQSFKKIFTFLYFFNTSLLLLIFLQITDPFTYNLIELKYLLDFTRLMAAELSFSIGNWQLKNKKKHLK